MIDGSDYQVAEDPVTSESQLLDALGEALIAGDLDLRVTSWNHAAELLYGWSTKEAMGQFFPGLIASNLMYEQAFTVVRTVRSGKVWRGRLKLRHRNGSDVQVSATASGIYDKQGNCTGYVSIHRPLSASSSEESAIEKTGVLFHSCNDIVVVIGEDGRIVAWNPAAERALKWKSMETLYHPYEEFLQPVTDLGVIISTLKQRGSWRGEVTVCDRYGDELLMDSDITAVKDHQGGKWLGVITISRDITHSRRSEAARRRSEARLRALLSVLPDTFLRVGRDGRIHDLVANGPFRGLLGAAMPDPPSRSAETSGTHTPVRRNLADLFPDLAPRLMALIEAAAGDRRVQHLTYRATVGGKQSDLIFRVIIDAAEEALIIVQDVTELYKMERELSESEERFRQLVEQKQVGVYLMQNERFQYVNPRFAELCGFDREEVLAMPSNLAIVVEEDRPMVNEAVRRRLSGDIVPPYSFRMRRKDGEIVDLEVYGAQIYFRGQPAILGTVLDVTQRKRAEVALRESEERHRTLVGALQEGVLFVGAEGQILTCNDSASRLLGLSRDQQFAFAPTGLGWQVLKEDGTPLLREEQPTSITLATGQPLSEVVVGLRKPTGELTWLSVNTRPLFRDGDPRPYAIVTSFVDITQRKRTQEELLRQAFYDPLTNLPNRALFMDRVERALSQARRSEQLVAVGYLDLDLFKHLNDTFGHLFGDLVLQQVALRLCRCLREGDTVARMGGDEFTLLLPNVSGMREAAGVAERLFEALRQPMHIENREFCITISLGISLYPQDGIDAAELLRKADHAMYRAKGTGKNTYALSSGQQHAPLSGNSNPPHAPVRVEPSA